MYLFNKFISLLLLITFIVTTYSYGLDQRDGAEEVPAYVSSKMMPESVGQVTERFIPNRNEDRYKNPVYIIEDLHCDPATQLNIKNILEEIKQKQGGIDLIGIEGSFALMNLNLINNIVNICLDRDGESVSIPKKDSPQIQNRQKKRLQKSITSQLLMTGYLSGPELFVLENQNTKIIGLEDEKVYRKNFMMLYKSLEYRDLLEDRLYILKDIISKAKEVIYLPKQKELEKYKKEYQNGRLSLVDYLKIVVKSEIIERGQSDIQEGLLKTTKYQAIKSYISINNLCSKIHQPGIKHESVLMLKRINNVLSHEERKTLKRLKNEAYYKYLDILLKRKHVKYETICKNLATYIKYLEQKERINYSKLLKETSELEYHVMKSLSKGIKDIEGVIYLEKYLNLLTDYINNKLSKKEIEEWEVGKEKFYKTLDDLGKRMNLSSYISDSKQDIDKVLQYMSSFYKLGNKRNEIFVKNLEDAIAALPQTVKGPGRCIRVSANINIKGEESPTTVLVAGGFHTQGIAQILRIKGIPYIVIRPKTGREIDKSIYLNRVKEQAGLLNITTAPPTIDKRFNFLFRKIEGIMYRAGYLQLIPILQEGYMPENVIVHIMYVLYTLNIGSFNENLELLLQISDIHSSEVSYSALVHERKRRRIIGKVEECIQKRHKYSSPIKAGEIPRTTPIQTSFLNEIARKGKLFIQGMAQKGKHYLIYWDDKYQALKAEYTNNKTIKSLFSSIQIKKMKYLNLCALLLRTTEVKDKEKYINTLQTQYFGKWFEKLFNVKELSDTINMNSLFSADHYVRILNTMARENKIEEKDEIDFLRELVIELLLANPKMYDELCNNYQYLFRTGIETDLSMYIKDKVCSKHKLTQEADKEFINFCIFLDKIFIEPKLDYINFLAGRSNDKSLEKTRYSFKKHFKISSVKYFIRENLSNKSLLEIFLLGKAIKIKFLDKYILNQKRKIPDKFLDAGYKHLLFDIIVNMLYIDYKDKDLEGLFKGYFQDFHNKAAAIDKDTAYWDNAWLFWYSVNALGVFTYTELRKSVITEPLEWFGLHKDSAREEILINMLFFVQVNNHPDIFEYILFYLDKMDILDKEKFFEKFIKRLKMELGMKDMFLINVFKNADFFLSKIPKRNEEEFLEILFNKLSYELLLESKKFLKKDIHLKFRTFAVKRKNAKWLEALLKSFIKTKIKAINLCVFLLKQSNIKNKDKYLDTLRNQYFGAWVENLLTMEHIPDSLNLESLMSLENHKYIIEEIHFKNEINGKYEADYIRKLILTIFREEPELYIEAKQEYPFLFDSTIDEYLHTYIYQDINKQHRLDSDKFDTLRGISKKILRKIYTFLTNIFIGNTPIKFPGIKTGDNPLKTEIKTIEKFFKGITNLFDIYMLGLTVKRDILNNFIFNADTIDEQQKTPEKFLNLGYKYIIEDIFKVYNSKKKEHDNIGDFLDAYQIDYHKESLALIKDSIAVPDWNNPWLLWYTAHVFGLVDNRVIAHMFREEILKDFGWKEGATNEEILISMIVSNEVNKHPEIFEYILFYLNKMGAIKKEGFCNAVIEKLIKCPDGFSVFAENIRINIDIIWRQIPLNNIEEFLEIFLKKVSLDKLSESQITRFRECAIEIKNIKLIESLLPVFLKKKMRHINLCAVLLEQSSLEDKDGYINLLRNLYFGAWFENLLTMEQIPDSLNLESLVSLEDHADIFKAISCKHKIKRKNEGTFLGDLILRIITEEPHLYTRLETEYPFLFDSDMQTFLSTRIKKNLSKKKIIKKKYKDLESDSLKIYAFLENIFIGNIEPDWYDELLKNEGENIEDFFKDSSLLEAYMLGLAVKEDIINNVVSDVAQPNEKHRVPDEFLNLGYKYIIEDIFKFYRQTKEKHETIASFLATCKNDYIRGIRPVFNDSSFWDNSLLLMLTVHMFRGPENEAILRIRNSKILEYFGGGKGKTNKEILINMLTCDEVQNYPPIFKYIVFCLRKNGWLEDVYKTISLKLEQSKNLDKLIYNINSMLNDRKDIIQKYIISLFNEHKFKEIIRLLKVQAKLVLGKDEKEIEILMIQNEIDLEGINKPWIEAKDINMIGIKEHLERLLKEKAEDKISDLLLCFQCFRFEGEGGLLELCIERFKEDMENDGFAKRHGIDFEKEGSHELLLHAMIEILYKNNLKGVEDKARNIALFLNDKQEEVYGIFAYAIGLEPFSEYLRELFIKNEYKELAGFAKHGHIRHFIESFSTGFGMSFVYESFLGSIYKSGEMLKSIYSVYKKATHNIKYLQKILEPEYLNVFKRYEKRQLLEIMVEKGDVEDLIMLLDDKDLADETIQLERGDIDLRMIPFDKEKGLHVEVDSVFCRAEYETRVLEVIHKLNIYFYKPINIYCELVLGGMKAKGIPMDSFLLLKTLYENRIDIKQSIDFFPEYFKMVIRKYPVEGTFYLDIIEDLEKQSATLIKIQLYRKFIKVFSLLEKARKALDANMVQQAEEYITDARRIFKTNIIYKEQEDKKIKYWAIPDQITEMIEPLIKKLETRTIEFINTMKEKIEKQLTNAEVKKITSAFIGKVSEYKESGFSTELRDELKNEYGLLQRQLEEFLDSKTEEERNYIYDEIDGFLLEGIRKQLDASNTDSKEYIVELTRRRIVYDSAIQLKGLEAIMETRKIGNQNWQIKIESVSNKTINITIESRTEEIIDRKDSIVEAIKNLFQMKECYNILKLLIINQSKEGVIPDPNHCQDLLNAA